MAKQGGLGMACYVDGVDLSGDIGSIGSISGVVNLQDITGIDKSAIERIPLMRSGSIAFNSWFNPTTVSGQHANLSTRPTTDRNIVVATAVTVLGDDAAGMVCKQINYDANRQQDGSLAFSIEAQSNAFPLEWGEALTAGKRSDSSATNPTSGLDDLIAPATTSAFGATMYVHLFSFTGTSVTFTLRDAATEPTYAAVTGGGSTAMSAIGAQRWSTSATQSIRRYLSIGTSGTFSNAVFFVIVVRHLAASI